MSVTARYFVDGQTVMNVMPMLRCGVSRIDAERFDSIDRLEDDGAHVAAVENDPNTELRPKGARLVDEPQRLGEGPHGRTAAAEQVRAASPRSAAPSA